MNGQHLRQIAAPLKPDPDNCKYILEKLIYIYLNENHFLQLKKTVKCKLNLYPMNYGAFERFQFNKRFSVHSDAVYMNSESDFKKEISS